MGIKVPVVRIGWPDKFIEHGKIDDLRAKYGLTVEDALAQLRPLLMRRQRPGRDWWRVNFSERGIFCRG